MPTDPNDRIVRDPDLIRKFEERMKARPDLMTLEITLSYEGRVVQGCLDFDVEKIRHELYEKGIDSAPPEFIAYSMVSQMHPKFEDIVKQVLKDEG